MPCQDLNGLNSMVKAPEGTIFPSSLHKRESKHTQCHSFPHEITELSYFNGVGDPSSSSDSFRRFNGAGLGSDPSHNNCSTNCPHSEWCLSLEKELVKVRQNLTKAKMINVSSDQKMIENEALKDEIRLLRVRLEGVENTLQVQKKTTASVHKRSSHRDGDATESCSTRNRLLQAWRYQVIRLLMERVAQEEVFARAKKDTDDLLNTQKEQITELETLNQALNCKLEAQSPVLNSNFRKVEDYSKEIQTSNNSNTCLNECTKSALTRLHADLIAMNEQWNRVFTDDGNTDSSPLMQRLRRLERRIQYVSGRLPMVRVLLSQKRVERMSCGVQVYGTLRLPPINAALPTNVEDLKEMVLAAQNELALAIADRDLIAKRLIMDAQDSDEKLSDLRRTHSHEISLLKRRLEEAEKSLGEKTLDLERAKERVSALEAEHKRFVTEITEEKVKLETELTDTKSDLTKALISVRRAERKAMQATSEKEAQNTAILPTFPTRRLTYDSSLPSTKQISALELEYSEKMAKLKKAQCEASRESLFRPPLPPLNRPAYLTPGEAFIHHDLPIHFALENGEKKAISCHKTIKPTKHEGSVLESLPGDQLESIRETLNKLANLAKQLEQQ
ncbi:unnamed protein product [Hydatigera taeniaeformis]|uniref:Coiled-coil alpha-helical rod protein 1 n=1 Tax=Hydatigena taeniaeformis TaxID=6205 RepID=A0A158RDM8_HYDTA|nr:unnamed protein product [Hydatigera taeniaeformis]